MCHVLVTSHFVCAIAGRKPAINSTASDITTIRIVRIDISWLDPMHPINSQSAFDRQQKKGSIECLIFAECARRAAETCVLPDGPLRVGRSLRDAYTGL